MFQPNVEEIGITSNLLWTGRRSVLRRGVKTGNLSAGKIKCKLNCNCCSYHYHYLIAHKSHTDLHSLGGIEKQLQARRSSDVNLNATITCEAWGWSTFKVQDPVLVSPPPPPSFIRVCPLYEEHISVLLVCRRE